MIPVTYVWPAGCNGGRDMRLALLLLVVTACFSPQLSFDEGSLRCDHGACPPGYTCSQDRCWRNVPPAGADAGAEAVDGAGAADAATIPVVDAGAPADVLVLPDADAGVACPANATGCASASQPEHCAGGVWVADPLCPSETPSCDHGVCRATCSAGDTRCLDPVTPEVCTTDGAWQARDACTYVCSSGSCTGNCTPSHTECRDNDLYTCTASGLWAKTQTCPNVCSAGACTGTCTVGATRCSPSAPNVPESCVGGTWQDQPPCAYACLGGTCTACVPNQDKKCENGAAMTCDASGNWVLAEACPYQCTKGACSGACTDGAHQCADSKTAQTCSGGVWSGDTLCPYVCDAATGQCGGECQPSATQCVGGVASSCDATGHWSPGTACTYLCVGNACGGVCRPGTQQCDGNGGLQTCTASSAWGTGTTCAYGCSAGACNACTPQPQTTTCSGKCGLTNDNCGNSVDCGGCSAKGPSWSCVSNTCTCQRDVLADCSGKCGTITDRCGYQVNCSQQSSGVPCNQAGQVCLAGGSCCTQDPLSTTCSGAPGAACGKAVTNNCGVQVSCGTACASGYSCGGDPATPTTCSCHPGAITCSGNTPETCNSAGTGWTSGMACASSCVVGVGCGQCTNGTTQCSGTALQTCQNGAWVTTSSCPGSVCDPTTKACGACAPGATRCTGNELQTCNGNGEWQDFDNCASPQSSGHYYCNPSKAGGAGCDGQCAPGTTQCTGGTALQTCSASYTWSTSPCSTGQCANGACCTQTQTQLCPEVGGAPCGTQTLPGCNLQVDCSCSSDYACTGGKCSCTAGTLRCDPNTTSVEQCAADGQSWPVIQTCASGCDQASGSCCESDYDYCKNRKLCGGTYSNCGRSVTCSIDCATVFGNEPTCGAVTPNQCGCTPFPSSCNGPYCDDSGVYHDGPGCASGYVCADCSNGTFCTTPAQCLHFGCGGC
jgi:hypothetical protein